MTDVETEQHRLECEAREWLRRCCYDPARIRSKLERLTKKRGDVSRLRAEMLRQFNDRKHAA